MRDKKRNAKIFLEDALKEAIIYVSGDRIQSFFYMAIETEDNVNVAGFEKCLIATLENNTIINIEF